MVLGTGLNTFLNLVIKIVKHKYSFFNKKFLCCFFRVNISVDVNAAFAGETPNALLLWPVSRLRSAVSRSVVLTTAVIARPVVLPSPKCCYLLHPRIRCFMTITYLCLVWSILRAAN